MKSKNIILLLAIGCIVGVELALFGTAYTLAAIPTGSLYGGDISRAGKVYQDHPSTNIRSLAAETVISFGRLVARGTNAVTQTKLFTSASDVIAGISLWSSDAGDLDNEKYSIGDAVGVLDEGIATVYVEEAVTPSDPVRVRHANEAATAAYQDAEFTSTKAGGDATGLANDTTAYTASIVINGIANAVSVVGSAAQTFTDLLTEINADLSGAVATIVDGNIRVTASVTGATGSVVITDTDLFATLTDFDALATAVAGSDDPNTDMEAGAFGTTAEAGKTALLGGFEYRGTTTGPGVVPIAVNKAGFSVTADE